MPERREFICITCPVGCTLQAVVEGDELIEIEGGRCSRGADFVREELTDPRRTLTTTVQVEGGILSLVPVRSEAPLPKALLLDVARALREVVLTAPVVQHQVVLEDALGSGVDIITSRSIARDKNGTFR
ncbi:MAG: DUF1667 domain-containing protein [Anaerolineales bacterium]